MLRALMNTRLISCTRYYSPKISQVSQFTCFAITKKQEAAFSNNKYKLKADNTLGDIGHYSTRVLQPVEEGNILKKVLKKVGFVGSTKTRLKVASFMLYESVADKINYIEFFNEFNLPNTFNSWFLVTELHVWMLLLRAMAEGSESGEDGRFLRNSIVEAMWADVNTRAKKLGANNPSGTRAQIEILSEQFQAALITYDEGVMSDDKVLAGALWRRFFEKKCDNYTALERLVKYVRQQVLMLDELTREQFIVKPKLNWLSFTDINI